MSTLNLAARCWSNPKIARVASSCVVQACEGTLNTDLSVPESIVSGLIDALQADHAPEVSAICACSPVM